MPRSAKLGWTVGSVAVPLLLSLTLHALLLLALWCWPTRTPRPTLSIETTRISLDTCVLEPRSPTLLPETELPLDLRGTTMQTSLAPQILDAPPLHSGTRGQNVPLGARSVSEGKHVLAHAAGSELGFGSGSLFPLPATATSVVFVLDRSVSMGMDRKLDFARRELIARLRRLPSAMRFQVIDYNDYAEALIVDGLSELLPAEPAIIEKAVSRLQTLDAAGKTNHLAALRRGLDLHPDVLYFLTDAGDLRPEEVAAVTRRNQGSVIHTIELTRRHVTQQDGPLVWLARENHGVYRCVSIPSSDQAGAPATGQKPVAGAPGL